MILTTTSSSHLRLTNLTTPQYRHSVEHIILSQSSLLSLHHIQTSLCNLRTHYECQFQPRQPGNATDLHQQQVVRRTILHLEAFRKEAECKCRPRYRGTSGYCQAWIECKNTTTSASEEPTGYLDRDRETRRRDRHYRIVIREGVIIANGITKKKKEYAKLGERAGRVQNACHI